MFLLYCTVCQPHSDLVSIEEDFFKVNAKILVIVVHLPDTVKNLAKLHHDLKL